MKSTSLSSAPPRRNGTGPWAEGTYLTDGTRLLCVVRIDDAGAEVEDARTEQLEWHPIRELTNATRAVRPSSIP
jgi:hypothetical protein